MNCGSIVYRDPVGKDVRKAATDILFEASPTFRRFQNPADCVLNGLDEPQSERRVALGVVEGCLLVLIKRLRMELISHRRRTSRTLPRAFSPGTVSTRFRTSSRLRFASATHSRSMCPNSFASKLSTRRSASRARDSLGRFMACSANSSTVVAIVPKILQPSGVLKPPAVALLRVPHHANDPGERGAQLQAILLEALLGPLRPSSTAMRSWTGRTFSPNRWTR